MLRVMLGVCGAVLIALGVFGGGILENTYNSVQAVMQPEVVIIKENPSAPLQQVNAMASVPDSDAVVTDVASDEALIAADVVEPEIVVTAPADKTLEIQTTKAMTEVKASAREVAAVEVAEPAVDTTIGELVPVSAVVASEQPVLLPKDIEVEEVVTTTAGSVPDNTLYVARDKVNLREGPSIDHPIVLELQLGQELMEFKREEKWIHVGAYGTSGKIGWVHSTLVGKDGIVTGE